MKRTVLASLLVLALSLSAFTACTPSSPQPQASASSPAESAQSSFAASGESAVNTPALSEQTIAKAQQLADTIVSDYGVPSVQYAIISEGDIILSGGSGIADRQTGAPVTADTMYCIGSTSKMFTVAAVMMLVDEGNVDLDTPLVAYIPEFKTTDEWYKQITPRMLMNYSSGLYGTNYKDGFTLDTPSTANHDELLENLANEGLQPEPGAYSVYCNDGITLLEILVERISGQSFTAFINERISQPLGLKNTTTPQDDFDRTRLAKLYHPLSAESGLSNDTVNLIGSGGIYSTAEEVCLVSQVLMGYRPDILSVESTQAMRAEEYKRGEWGKVEEGFFAYGLGWDSVHTFPFESYGIQAVSKGGSTLLTNSSLVTIPEHNLAMVVASSGGSAFFNQVMVCTILQEVLKEKGIIEEILPPRATSAPQQQEMPADFEQYSGLYGGPLRQPFEVTIADGGFDFTDPLGLSSSSKFVYAGDDTFINEDGTLKLSFETAESGKIYLLVDSMTELPGLGQAAITYAAGQKLDGEALSDSLASIWKAREGRYYILDDSPTSQLYMGMLFNFDLAVNAEHSYAMGCQIIDENTAVNDIVVPMLHVSCDTSDLEFFTQNNREYLKTKGYTLLSEHSLPTLDMTEKSHTIGENGYANWQKISDSTAGQQVTVSLPQGGTFTIFDQDGTCTFFSAASGLDHAVLPDGGAIAFIGAPGDTFDVQYANA